MKKGFLKNFSFAVLAMVVFWMGTKELHAGVIQGPMAHSYGTDLNSTVAALPPCLQNHFNDTPGLNSNPPVSGQDVTKTIYGDYVHLTICPTTQRVINEIHKPKRVTLVAPASQWDKDIRVSLQLDYIDGMKSLKLLITFDYSSEVVVWADPGATIWIYSSDGPHRICLDLSYENHYTLEDRFHSRRATDERDSLCEQECDEEVRACLAKNPQDSGSDSCQNLKLVCEMQCSNRENYN